MLKSPNSHLLNPCPFCKRCYKKLGNHLKYCSERDGRDYQAYLSQKTLSKRSNTSKKKPCGKCGRLFYRLDTHLRNSAQCRELSIVDPQNPLESSQQDHTLVHATPALGSTTLLAEHNTSQEVSLCSISEPVLSPQSKTPFNYPRTKDEWLAADEQLASVVVPQVLAAPTIEKKNQALCSGVYDYFVAKYGTQPERRSRKKSKRHKCVQQERARLREERNKARQ